MATLEELEKKYKALTSQQAEAGAKAGEYAKLAEELADEIKKTEEQIKVKKDCIEAELAAAAEDLKKSIDALVVSEACTTKKLEAVKAAAEVLEGAGAECGCKTGAECGCKKEKAEGAAEPADDGSEQAAAELLSTMMALVEGLRAAERARKTRITAPGFFGGFSFEREEPSMYRTVEVTIKPAEPAA